MIFLLKALQWLKTNVWSIVVSVIAIFGAGIFWSYHRGKIRGLEIDNEIEESYKKIAVLNTEMRILEDRKQDNMKLIEAVQARKKEIVKEAVNLEKDVEKMTDKEIEQAFINMF